MKPKHHYEQQAFGICICIAGQTEAHLSSLIGVCLLARLYGLDGCGSLLKLLLALVEQHFAEIDLLGGVLTLLRLKLRQLAIQVLAQRGVDLAESWLSERLIKYLSPTVVISHASTLYYNKSNCHSLMLANHGAAQS